MNVVVAKKTETPIEKLPPKQAGLIQLMANRYSMDPQTYANAVKKTAMPGNATNEEFAAFLMVAHEYKLNPLLKEIYAFPKKGGGIAPMVSIDGWLNLINSNPLLNGFEIEMHYDDKNKLVACTCKMHRKDRSFPTVITEYLSECKRNTDPWKMEHRMLRHKAIIQAARYCFGLAGIYDEDEAADQMLKDVTPTSPVPPAPKLQDFVNPARASGGDGAAAGEGTNQTPAAATETIDPETGELPPLTAEDAFEDGNSASLEGKPPKVPDAFKDGGMLQEAWLKGYAP